MSIAALALPVVGSLAGTVVGAGIAWVVNTRSTAQRERSEWWTRFRDALAMTRDEDKDQARLGADLLRAVLRSSLMGPDEQEIAAIVFRKLYTEESRSTDDEGGSDE